MLKFFYTKKGFTLTELLICVMILSVISAIAIPVIDKKQKKQKANDCRMQCEMIEATVKVIMDGMEDNGSMQFFIPGAVELVADGTKHYVVKCNADGEIVSETEEAHSSDGSFSRKCKYCGGDIDADYSISYGTHINNSVLVTNDKDGNELNVPIVPTSREAEEDKILKDEYGEPILDDEGNIQYEYQKDEDGKDVLDEDGNRVTVKESFTYTYTIIKEYKYIKLTDLVTLSDIRGGYRPSANLNYKDYTKSGYYLKKSKLADKKLIDCFANGEMPVCPFDKNGTKGYFYYLDGSGCCHCTCPHCQ